MMGLVGRLLARGKGATGPFTTISRVRQMTDGGYSNSQMVGRLPPFAIEQPALHHRTSSREAAMAPELGRLAARVPTRAASLLTTKSAGTVRGSADGGLRLVNARFCWWVPRVRGGAVEKSGNVSTAPSHQQLGVSGDAGVANQDHTANAGSRTTAAMSQLTVLCRQS